MMPGEAAVLWTGNCAFLRVGDLDGKFIAIEKLRSTISLTEVEMSGRHSNPNLSSTRSILSASFVAIASASKKFYRWLRFWLVSLAQL